MRIIGSRLTEFDCIIGTLMSLLLFISPILGSIGLVNGEVTDQVIVSGIQTSDPDLFYSKGNYILAYSQELPDPGWGMSYSLRSMRSTDLKSWTDVDLNISQLFDDPDPTVVEMNGTIYIFYNGRGAIFDLIIGPDGSKKNMKVREYMPYMWHWEELLSPTAVINNGTIYLLYIYDYEWGGFQRAVERHIEMIESPDGLTWNNITIGAELTGDPYLKNNIDSFIKDDGFIYVFTNSTNWNGKAYGYFFKEFNGSDAKRYSNLTTKNISIIMASNGNYYIADDNGIWVSSDDGNNWIRAFAHNFSEPSMIQDEIGNIIIVYENSGEIRKWEYSPLMVNISLDTEGTKFYAGSSSKIEPMILDNNYSIKDYEWISSRDGVVSKGHTSALDMGKLTVGTHKIHLRVLDNMQVWSESNDLTITIRKSTDNKSTCFELASIIIFGAIIVTFAFGIPRKGKKKITRKKRKSKNL